MADQQLKSFVKHVILAAKKQEEKKKEKDFLQKQVGTVKKLAGTKRVEKDKLKQAITELESRINKISEREGALIAEAEQEHHSSGEIKTKIADIEKHLYKLGLEESNTSDMLRRRIKDLEYELRLSKARRAEEIHLNRKRIEEIKTTISELKGKILKIAKSRVEREGKVNALESRLKKEATENRDGIAQLEAELAKIKPKKEKVSIFDKLKAMFHKKPKIEKYVNPQEMELFREKPKEMPLPKIKPIIKERPVVKHDIIFEETEAHSGIPQNDDHKLDLPPPPKPPLITPKKKGFFAKLFGKKEKF
ncbi:MAG: hypothetical protein V3V78_00010 [Candidatus Woesearchaeota archaeon]